MDYIEEILNLREQIKQLQQKVATLEAPKKNPLVKCSKCGVERHPLFKRQCLDPECEGRLTVKTCKSANPNIVLGGMNLEVGPNYKDSNSIGDLNEIISSFDSKSQITRDERDKYNRDVAELMRHWRDNPECAPKY